jgi:UDP-3-O-[3-hydroxymyristoyl] glucosamine N-acyltransferase
MEFTAAQIAAQLNGVVEGNPEAKVSSLSKIEEGRAGTLSFLANPKYAQYIYSTEASVVIVSTDFIAEQPVKATLVRVADAYKSFATLLEFYNQIKLKKAGIEQPSFISDKASIGENVYVGAFAYVGSGAKIGKNVKKFIRIVLLAIMWLLVMTLPYFRE